MAGTLLRSCEKTSRRSTAVLDVMQSALSLLVDAASCRPLCEAQRVSCRAAALPHAVAGTLLRSCGKTSRRSTAVLDVMQSALSLLVDAASC
ncbi:MAG: hypothetical protein IJI14_00305, partial [Anaerolineaceae bacterium]|nr:hypothetical protein [Anaerolineaceae bacterium]